MGRRNLSFRIKPWESITDCDSVEGLSFAEDEQGSSRSVPESRTADSENSFSTGILELSGGDCTTKWNGVLVLVVRLGPNVFKTAGTSPL